ncbi:phytanoyl-CoA dioxygenase family protein [Runella salmonicolor]|uniref:Phytanoyl-CoA dioxygenase family protein n=1 Tax=Runella salmonicolor TaxID=2950278 RepID=A0ABT1FHF4_9BACT|nr:phytanoyl-CoA dioxygenase family protein [Runella salmonicolor]MCP1381196.1 phytanoyl-CoA dioxygenase family protein [Runella salmonicolor]
MNIVNFSSDEFETKQIEVAHLEEVLKDFRRDGYVIFKDIFPKEYVNSLYSDFINTYGHYFSEENDKNVIKVGNKRIQVSVEVKGAFNSPNLYANPFVLNFLRSIFNNCFIISDLTCVSSLPGAKKMRIHRDGAIFEGLALAPLLPAHAIGLLIPLIPFTRLNGPTRYWPGSHRINQSLADFEENLNFIEPEIDTGSCILMDHRLVHSGNPNRSEQIRPLLYCNYSLPWYFDYINFKHEAHLKVEDTNFEKIPEEYKPFFQRRNMKLL